MILFCPKCGDQLRRDANFCVRCGVDLRGVAQPMQSDGSLPTSTMPTATSPNERAQNSSNPKKSTLSFKTSNGFFYSLVTFLAVSALAAPIIYIGAGEKMGKQSAPFFIWVVILSYAVLKRLGRSRSVSLFSAIAIAFGALALVGVADGLVNSDRYAIEREWDKNSALVAIKENDPKAYSKLLSDVAKTLRTEPKPPERQQKAALQISSAMKVYFQRTSESALIGFYKAKHRHLSVLIHQDPSLCYEYSWGSLSTEMLKLPEAIRNENKVLLANVIKSASPSAVTVNAQRAQQSLEKVYAFAERKLGEEAVLLGNLEKRSGDAIGTCKAMVAFSGTLINVLSAPDAANLIRYLMLEG
jgi:hypothetical protein